MRDAASRGGWGDGGMRRAAAAAGASLLPARGPGIAAAGPEKEMSDLGLHAGGKGAGGSRSPQARDSSRDNALLAENIPVRLYGKLSG